MNEITTRDSMVPALANPFGDDVFESLGGGANFLPRLQLFTSNSEAVKSEKVPMNCWGLVTGAEIDNLGKEADVLVITRRPKAIDMRDKNNIRVSYQIQSDLFMEIKNTADTVQNSNCQYGKEYLVWVPKRGVFATLLMGSPTARVESRMVDQFLGKPMTLRSKPIDTGKYKYQGPSAGPCSTPFEIPDQDIIVKVANEFLSPSEQVGLEKVEQESRDR